MKKYLWVILLGFALAVGACSTDNSDRPIPGTLQSTSTKDNSNINNTPRTNPTPNPEPGSYPPDEVTQQTVIEQ